MDTGNMSGAWLILGRAWRLRLLLFFALCTAAGHAFFLLIPCGVRTLAFGTAAAFRADYCGQDQLDGLYLCSGWPAGTQPYQWAFSLYSEAILYTILLLAVVLAPVCAIGRRLGERRHARARGLIVPRRTVSPLRAPWLYVVAATAVSFTDCFYWTYLRDWNLPMGSDIHFYLMPSWAALGVIATLAGFGCALAGAGGVRRRIAAGEFGPCCVGCGYPVPAGAELPCPECGRVPGDPAPPRRGAWRWARGIVLGGAIGVVVVTALLMIALAGFGLANPHTPMGRRALVFVTWGGLPSREDPAYALNSPSFYLPDDSSLLLPGRDGSLLTIVSSGRGDARAVQVHEASPPLSMGALSGTSTSGDIDIPIGGLPTKSWTGKTPSDRWRLVLSVGKGHLAPGESNYKGVVVRLIPLGYLEPMDLAEARVECGPAATP